MPLFEVEGDRHQIVPGSGAGIGTTAHRVVDTHIDGLLGEQIFPVAPGNGPHEPHLLALDASGAPVVVELVSHLDDDALTRALDHAGAAGRMTRGQLAARYRGGAQAFQRDVAEFYDSVPITRSHSGRPGARLIIICQDADQAVLNAVDFLRQPSMPVEVLRLDVVHSVDGRKLVDVSPLVIHPESAPDKPEVVRAPLPPELGATATGVPLSKKDLEEAVAVGLALTGKMPVVVKDARPAEQLDAVPLPGVPAAVAAAEKPATAAEVPLPVPEAPAALAAPVRQSVRRRSRTDRFSTAAPRPAVAEAPEPIAPVLGAPPAADVAPIPEPTLPAFDLTDPTPHLEDLARIRRETLAGFAINPADDPLAWNPSERWYADAEPEAAPEPEVQPAPTRRSSAVDRDAIAFGEVFARVSAPLDALDPEWAGVTEAEAAPATPWWREEPEQLSWDSMAAEPAPAAPAPAVAPAWDPPATGPIVIDEDTDADLIALAANIGVATALVWERPRRGQRFDAVLHPDGRIQLSDGFHYRHPDIAAAAASGSYSADDWSVWRLGTPSGPTLEEEFRARFA